MKNNTSTMERPILIVDDEREILAAVERILRMAGMTHTITINDARDVIRQIERQVPRLILLDLNMPHINGVQILKIVRKSWPRIPVIVLTASIEVNTAVNCMKLGAMDYLLKPVEEQRLLGAVEKVLAYGNRDGDGDGEGVGQVSPPEDFLARIKNPGAFSHIITQDPKMHSVFHYIEAIAPSSMPVLIFGETGVGKELIGKAIHALGKRRGKLEALNVAGLDDNVFSDTLFGHVPGAFTGAQKVRPGIVEQAAGGTLFLDEIGDLTLTSQVKLLRLLQEGEYRPLGSDETRRADVRIIASTHQDLWALEKKGAFRKDLIYRLSTHTLTLPPLRKRLVDLPLLLDRFICQAANELDKPVPDIPKSLIELMERYPFKGNIRELKSMVHDAVFRHGKGPITADLFKGLPGGAPGDISGPGRSCLEEETLPTLKQASRELVEKALKKAGGNQSAAARILGISQQALSKRLQKLKAEET